MIVTIFVEIKSFWEFYKMFHAFLQVTGNVFSVNQRALQYFSLKELGNTEQNTFIPAES